MSLWHIAWSYLWNRWLTTSLTILSVALAVGLISALLTVRNESRQRFEEEQQAYDIVVGPPGSPLQLVLNSVYFLDTPVGRMPYEDYLRLKRHEDVTHAFPIGLGDTYGSFRIVGTVPEIKDYPWTNAVTGEDRYPFRIAEGRFFEEPMEAVLGYLAARRTGLGIGDTFTGRHGFVEIPEGLAEFDHRGRPYEVVGILEPSSTSNDRAIFVDLQSVWQIHDPDHMTVSEDIPPSRQDSDLHGQVAAVPETEDPEHGEVEDERVISAVLVDLYSPTQRFQFVDYVRDNYRATAAIPVQQILNLYNQILAPAVTIVMAVGYVVVVISALSILIGLYLSIIQRKRDLAIMRALGASGTEVFGAVLIEAFLVTVLGIGAGWVLGKGLAAGVGLYMSRAYGFAITGFSTSAEELGFFGVVALVGLLAGIIPAWQAYRTDIAKDLAIN